MNLESASSVVSRSLKMRKTESEADEERPSCSTTEVAESADPTEPKAFRAQRLRTVTLINLAAVMERMDEQVRRCSAAFTTLLHALLRGA